MTPDTSSNPRRYIIYGMGKIWGIADSYSELDKLCTYMEKGSRKDLISDFEIVVFDGLTIIGKVPFNRRTDLLYPENIIFGN